jgi:hypothetical protein
MRPLYQIHVRDILSLTFCIGVGIMLLRLSIDPRFSGGSLPNVNLLVAGLASGLVYPVFRLVSRPRIAWYISAIVASLIAVLFVVVVLAFLVLFGWL